MAQVKVTLDITGSAPKFKFVPDPVPIEPGQKETIQWTRASANFDFVALVFDHPNPFSNVWVKDEGMSAEDLNQTKKDHPYDVLVKASGKYYSSKDGIMGPGGPTIRNK